MLIIETAKLLGVEDDDVIISACAVEMLHTYSLIHDDLPAMDNDDFRRGKPSSHKKFNEETAILAGDSLLTMSFEILSVHLKNRDFETRCKIIEILSKAAGFRGMCLGQSMDLMYEKSGKLKSGKEAEKINKLKTGALFKACMEIGVVLGKANATEFNALILFAEHFGQAFQLRDDLEDKEIDETNIDMIKGKIALLIHNCFESLNIFDAGKVIAFKELARFCLD
jgi:geranylgeranyl pyrophosphate synthase